ncbi:MAG TPA: helix-turn-helix domain-containing protein [Candidatus Limnocylindria bacterium]|nr:helix-turn-helix domain-containing protein [Candidatus Limnocylindria bacterium]
MNSSAMDELNQEFLRLLAASGWKKARAAVELHVDPSAVTRYVNGEARPSLTVLRLFAEILGERLLVGGADDVPTALREGPRHLEAWERNLLDRLHRIEPAKRRPAIEALVQFLDAFPAVSAVPVREGSRPVPPVAPRPGAPALNDAPPAPVAAGSRGKGRVSSARPSVSSAGMEADALLGAVVAGQTPVGGPSRAPRAAWPSGSKPARGRPARPASSRASRAATPVRPAPGNPAGAVAGQTPSS